MLYASIYKWKHKYMSGQDYIRTWKTNIPFFFFFGKDLLPYQNHIGKKNLNFLIKRNASCMCHNILYIQSFTTKLSAFMT